MCIRFNSYIQSNKNKWYDIYLARYYYTTTTSIGDTYVSRLCKDACEATVVVLAGDVSRVVATHSVLQVKCLMCVDI